jgi:glycosyltransferase involved in cell wall biosynthesis
MVEALASGVPVAAYPVAGPLDILGLAATGTGGDRKPIGALDQDLGKAIALALTADRGACATEGRRYDWARCTDQFLGGIATIAQPAIRHPLSGTPRPARAAVGI